MSKTLENLRTGKYEVVDNQGVSVTQHFIECLEKEFADLEAKLAEKDEQIKRRVAVYEKQFIEQTDEIYKLTQRLADKDKEIEYQENMKILAVDNQNKKAIEQLEKVKLLLQNAVNFEHPEYDLVGVYDAINDQINELKGEE